MNADRLHHDIKVASASRPWTSSIPGNDTLATEEPRTERTREVSGLSCEEVEPQRPRDAEKRKARINPRGIKDTIRIQKCSSLLLSASPRLCGSNSLGCDVSRAKQLLGLVEARPVTWQSDLAGKTRSRSKQLGFLLIEAMIATVILAVAAMGIVSLLVSAHDQQLTIQENNTAMLLARQLMEEIAAKPLGTYVTGQSSGARSAFTTACQYNGYTDSSGPTGDGIETITGVSVLLPPDYTRVVSIAGTTAAQTTPPYDVCAVTVAVTTPSGKTITLTKWLANVTWGF